MFVALLIRNYWKPIAVAAFAVIAIAVLSSVVSGAFERKVAERTNARVEAITKTLQGQINEAAGRERVLIKKIDTSDSLIASLKKEIKQHEVVTYKTRVIKHVQPTSSAGSGSGSLVCHSASDPPVLTDAAVRVLDAARRNVDPDPVAGIDAAGETASDVALSEFVENDLEVVRLYHELAARHDELVSYVESIMNQQAK